MSSRSMLQAAKPVSTAAEDKVGKTASHGCIRLTNWDAMDLSTGVEKGTPVTFLDE